MTAVDKLVDRASDIIYEACDELDAARALAAAGLLVTDEVQALLDAVSAYDARKFRWAAHLVAAADAYLASRQVTT